MKDVSILVLLEVSLRRVHTRRMGLFLFCFNPCFIGSISEAVMNSAITNQRLMVSILVLLEVSLRHIQELALETVVREFQSLFYWKYL